MNSKLRIQINWGQVVVTLVFLIVVQYGMFLASDWDLGTVGQFLRQAHELLLPLLFAILFVLAAYHWLTERV